MAIFINNGGAAKKVSRADSIKVNIGGVARSAKAMKINIGGVAKDVFLPVVNLYRYGVLIQTLICDSNGYVTLPTMSSEYEDDTFYGWSVSSSSTVRIYTAGQSIKLTKVLNLYAVYQYISGTTPKMGTLHNSSATTPDSARAMGSGTATIKGFTLNKPTSSSGSVSYGDITYSSNGTIPYCKHYHIKTGLTDYVSGTVVYNKTYLYRDYVEGDIFTIRGINVGAVANQEIHAEISFYTDLNIIYSYRV